MMRTCPRCQALLAGSKCRRCGFTTARPSRLRVMMGILGLLAVVAVLSELPPSVWHAKEPRSSSAPGPVAARPEPAPAPPRAPTCTESDAWVVGSMAVEKTLSPKPAKVVRAERRAVRQAGDCVWTVSGRVDTVNDFNAPTRAYYHVTVMRDATGGWSFRGLSLASAAQLERAARAWAGAGQSQTGDPR